MNYPMVDVLELFQEVLRDYHSGQAPYDGERREALFWRFVEICTCYPRGIFVYRDERYDTAEPGFERGLLAKLVEELGEERVADMIKAAEVPAGAKSPY